MKNRLKNEKVASILSGHCLYIYVNYVLLSLLQFLNMLQNSFRLRSFIPQHKYRYIKFKVQSTYFKIWVKHTVYVIQLNSSQDYIGWPFSAQMNKDYKYMYMYLTHRLLITLTSGMYTFIDYAIRCHLDLQRGV